MQVQRLNGPGAGVLKYDLLTALTTAGLNGPPSLQTTIMRLIALMTARYNWQADELCVGQREMARMWSVNERTVKREIKRLTEAGLLVCTRSGVRGRVGAYRLDQKAVVRLSESCWPLVGPDFEARMRERYAPARSNVVHLKPEIEPEDRRAPEKGTWARVMAALAVTSPDVAGAWFARIDFVGFDHGILRLRTPSLFFRRYLETHLMGTLLRAVEAEMGPVQKVEFSE